MAKVITQGEDSELDIDGDLTGEENVIAFESGNRSRKKSVSFMDESLDSENDAVDMGAEITIEGYPTLEVVESETGGNTEHEEGNDVLTHLL